MNLVLLVVSVALLSSGMAYGDPLSLMLGLIATIWLAVRWERYWTEREA